MSTDRDSKISPDALRAVRNVVSHDACADGLASAMLARDALPGAHVSFLSYGTDAHAALEPTSGTLFCDFSPHPARVLEFAAAGTIVLDHHRTAAVIVHAMGAHGVYADEHAEPGVSGAVLVYRHVWRPLRAGTQHESFAERFAALAGVYDTGQREDPRWPEARIQAKVLMLFPPNWWLAHSLEEVAAGWNARFAWLGDALVAAEADAVRRAIERAYRFRTSKGTRVTVLSSDEHVSAAAYALESSSDVVVAFAYYVDGGSTKIRIALRSRGAFDCTTLAQNLGGGGHTRAAGFTHPVASQDPHPFRAIETWFADW